MHLQEVSSIYSVDPINSSLTAAEVLRKNFEDADREYMVSVNLDAKNRPISFHIVGTGTLTAVHFSTANVFKVALLQNACSVILCHNHPSGSTAPSSEDLDATKEMIQIGKMLSIQVLDHFILTPYDYVSLRESYPEVFR